MNCEEVEADSEDIGKMDWISKTLAETVARISDWNEVVKRFDDFRASGKKLEKNDTQK